MSTLGMQGESMYPEEAVRASERNAAAARAANRQLTPQRLKWLTLEASHAERIGQVGITLAELKCLLEAAEALTEIADADYRGNRSPESERARRALDAWSKA